MNVKIVELWILKNQKLIVQVIWGKYAYKIHASQQIVHSTAYDLCPKKFATPGLWGIFIIIVFWFSIVLSSRETVYRITGN